MPYICSVSFLFGFLLGALVHYVSVLLDVHAVLIR